MGRLIKIILTISAISLLVFSFRYYSQNRILKLIIGRLEADSRIAEVIVTGVRQGENIIRPITTIKFLEYDSAGRPMEPRYFTFAGNIIQFQSLVIRFDDIHIRQAHKLKGKSAYLFLKVFMLDGKNTQEYQITDAGEIPQGYKVSKSKNSFEERLWHEFWRYAIESGSKRAVGIKNAQIEAPGTMFVPGLIYTIKIEHDGGMRIDSTRLPDIVMGEKIPDIDNG